MYGFSRVVEYTHAEDAARAIKELNGYEVLGRKVRLREVRLQSKFRYGYPPKLIKSNLYLSFRAGKSFWDYCFIL